MDERNLDDRDGGGRRVEKLLPQKGVATGTILLFIAALGLAVGLAPGSVPGLTIPG
jgi:hypothetical protein